MREQRWCRLALNFDLRQSLTMFGAAIAEIGRVEVVVAPFRRNFASIKVGRLAHRLRRIVARGILGAKGESNQ